MEVQTFDYVVVGGGIFGIYTALLLAKRKARVLLLEKDARLFSRASVINQARLHGGYHYPRSIATARVSHMYKEKFMRDHMPMVNHRFKQYYGIDKTSSFTSDDQFISFCHYLGLPLQKAEIPDYFNAGQFEALYLTDEYSFDPTQLAAFYSSKISDCPYVNILLNTIIQSVTSTNDYWELLLQNTTGHQPLVVQASSVINATYSSINVLNQLFGQQKFAMTHEIAEVVIASSSLKDTGLTVIDGDFASFMPYGNSDFLSLSSVRYTSHSICDGDFPQFACQDSVPLCQPNDCRTCHDCNAKPRSNQEKMMHQIGKYISSGIKLQYLHSMFTVKSKLKSSYIDDSRPTLIQKMQDSPGYHCIFGGKISSVYEIESHFDV